MTNPSPTTVAQDSPLTVEICPLNYRTTTERSLDNPVHRRNPPARFGPSSALHIRGRD